jgi:PEGA domain
MQNIALRILSAFLLVTQTTPVPGSPSQPGTTEAPASSAPTPSTLAAACQQPCLEDGTPVKLRMSQTVSSADAHVNDRVQFEVLEEIKVSGMVVIPKGGIAWANVTEAEPKRRMARGGKLEIVMDSVRLADGEKAALRATQEAKGGGHTGAMTAGIVATGLIFFPAAPFFLFMHGKDITIPQGTEVPTFVDGNFQLDLTKFQPNNGTVAQAPPVDTQSSSAAAGTAEVSITSNVSGADIEIDGAFVGSTPSTLTVPSGPHTIDVKKAGYATWERKIQVTGGKIAVSADLQAASTPPAQSSQ